MAAWCLAHHQENFLYTRFDELCEIFAAYDVAFSLGDGLRPGSIADANDEAQLAELRHPRRADRRSPGSHDVQVMIEGPGHVPHAQDRGERRASSRSCATRRRSTRSARSPPTSRPGYDHITSAIGAAMIGWYGTAMLCYVTPKEHLGPARPRRRQGGGDRLQDRGARRRPGQGPPRRPGVGRRPVARPASSSAGTTSSTCRSTPTPPARTTTRRCRPEPAKTAHFCSMCGPKFCSMRITQDVRDYAAARARHVKASSRPSSWA